MRGRRAADCGDVEMVLGTPAIDWGFISNKTNESARGLFRGNSLEYPLAFKRASLGPFSQHLTFNHPQEEVKGGDVVQQP